MNPKQVDSLEGGASGHAQVFETANGHNCSDSDPEYSRGRRGLPRPCSEPDDLRDTHVHVVLAGAASEIPRRQPLASDCADSPAQISQERRFSPVYGAATTRPTAATAPGGAPGVILI